MSARDLFHNVVKDALVQEGWTITHDPLPVGQFLNYRRALRAVEPDRTLYLAIPRQTYDEFFRLRFIQEGIQEYQLKLIVYDVDSKEIMQWIN